MRLRVAAIAVALALSACAGDRLTRATTALGIACDGLGATVGSVTGLIRAGKVSRENVVRAQGILRKTDKICMPGSEVDPEDALVVVEQAARALDRIRSAARGD